MSRDALTTDRLRKLVSKIKSLTESHELQWERQIGSAHRYASWDNNLLILGPNASQNDPATPRYLFITPLDSPQHIEINSEDEALGSAILDLVRTVESASANKKSVDPFALTDELLESLNTSD